MKYRLVDVRYDVESYDEIRKLVDAGESVECRCWVNPWCEADFVVEKNSESGEYVVREEFDTPIENHSLEDFTLHQFIKCVPYHEPVPPTVQSHIG